MSWRHHHIRESSFGTDASRMRSAVFTLAAFAVIETQTDTFQSCEVPRFEWAAHGNRVTGRMYGMPAAMTDNHIFAGGYLKSTLDPEAAGFVESPTDYAVTGPTSDWNGTKAHTITVDLNSYPTTGGVTENAGGSWCACEAGVVKIRRLRVPRTGYVNRSRPSPTMLGCPLLDGGPISLSEDGLDADQAEHRYAAWVAP